jgi:nuclear pore complex protein Nup107
VTSTDENDVVNGRLGVADKLVADMSVESISLASTAALCGYSFDFTQAGAEEQDEEQVAAAMRRSSSGRDSVRPSQIPSAQDHAELVQSLRAASQTYYELSQLVRLIIAFRLWRDEEDALISLVPFSFPRCSLFQASQLTFLDVPLSQRSAAQQISTKRAKELFSSIEATFTILMDPSHDPTSPTLWPLYRAYFPDLVLAYLSMLQSGSFFIHRDSATKAMDLATLVADSDREWLQRAFLETGKMSALVDALALVAKAMLRLGEHDGKTKGGKKRSSKGETLRIWDVNVRN